MIYQKVSYTGLINSLQVKYTSPQVMWKKNTYNVIKWKVDRNSKYNNKCVATDGTNFGLLIMHHTGWLISSGKYMS